MMTMQIITRQEAVQQGLSRYFTGKPCKHGHIAERMRSNGRCIVCLKSASKIWKKANVDKSRAYGKKHYSKNKEQINARNKKYWDRNKDRLNAAHRAWVQKNKERKRQMDKEYAAKNRDKINASSRAYYARNKVECRERCARRGRMQKLSTPKWANFSAILLKYKERETMSLVTGLVHHVDHIIPLQGENVCGLHIAENLRVILARDNLAKSNKHA